MKGIEKFEYKYNGEIDFIDINTLLTTQIHFVSIINEVQRNIFPEIDLKINVEAPKKGSFIFQQIFEWTANSDIFTKDKVEYLSNLGGVVTSIMVVVGSLYELFKFLKGRKAEKIEDEGNGKIKIKNNEGDILIVENVIFNLYTSNQSLNDAFRKQAEALENDINVEGIQIINQDKNEIIVDVKRDSFNDFTNNNEYINSSIIEKPKPSIRLFIKKPDLFPKTDKVTWEFIYDGRNIRAIITDSSFIDKINNGLRVGQGDCMVVDLIIIAEYDKRFNTHIDKKYEIPNVISIEEKPNNLQTELF
jgi:hypothetical protein